MSRLSRKTLGSLAILASLFFVSCVAAGTIVGSAHDFSARGWGGTDEICIFCHTPHNAETTVSNTPLWNHELTSLGDFTKYSSDTLDAIVDQPSGISILCLSCHDGSVAVDSFGGTTGTQNIADRVNLTKDLSDDHPISFTYNPALADTDGGLLNPTTTTVTIGSDKTKTGSITDILLFAGKLECASCHDVHNTFATELFLLKISNANSDLCLTCHDK